MKSKSILSAALCLVTATATAQVVFGENEKDYVRPLSSVDSLNVTLGFNPSISTVAANRFHISGIGDNWFISGKAGTSIFIGTPIGCGDLFDRMKPSFTFSLGKWHSRYFGTRAVFQGFQFVNSDALSTGYQNIHGDLMLNVSSFYRSTYDPLPLWNVIPYVGAGIIRNNDLKKNPFAFSYGLICSYRISERLNISAELGGTSTFQNFDGKGKGKRFGDDLYSVSIGITANIGKLGWRKKKMNVVQEQLLREAVEQTPYPRNDYEGLRKLRERMNTAPEEETPAALSSFDAPILFFFKINSTKFIDKQQKVNINEIAAAVKEYNLHVRIVGAADSKTGTPEYNRKLSIKRARYIAKLLKEAGVPINRMTGAAQGGIDIYKPYTANRHTCVILYQK